jgi:hypothetical protein
MINDVSEDHTAAEISVSAYHNTRCYKVEDINVMFYLHEPFQAHVGKTTYRLTRRMLRAYGDMGCV